MTEKRRLTERITESSYVADLEQRSIDELKEMRAECRDGENEVSFERRLCQGRIDILKAELARRSGKGDSNDLVSRLPEILAGEGSSHAPALEDSDTPLPSRAPDFSTPRSADIPRRRVDEILGEQTLAKLRDLSEAEIEDTLGKLKEHEARLSSRRKAVHEAMDKIQAEIVRRYQSGEADPTAALA